MILTYKQCLKRYGTDYRIKKEIEAGRLYKKQRGVYSDTKICSDIEIIIRKYPKAIITGESAYYYYGLTDRIPECFHLVTNRTDSRIKDRDVCQYFSKTELFELGKTSLVKNGIVIPIYSKERMLVELIRQRNKISFDFYKELVNSYRRIIEELDFFKIEECVAPLKNRKSILKAIELEIL